MTYDQCEVEIQKLEHALDKSVSDERMKVIFEYVEEWSAYRLRKVVDFLIRNSEKSQFPTIQQILKAGEIFLDPKGQQEFATSCDFCENQGTVGAIGKDGYKVLFRCNQCKSLNDGYWEKVIFWGKEVFEKGYRLERNYTVQPLNPEKPEDLGGIRFMKENSPKLYFNFLRSVPVEQAKKWEECLDKIPMKDDEHKKEMEEIQKEIERKLSLKQEAKREAPIFGCDKI